MRNPTKILVTILSLMLASISWSADFAAGQEAYNTADYQAAFDNWLPLAESGDADSQYSMGLLYANGFGVPLDDDLALKWYLLAADQGHGPAMCNIAVMHANGWGVPQSDEEAFNWYSLAAEQGVTPAQAALATMYSNGFGVSQDDIQAYKWYTIASELGDLNAPTKRDYITSRMSAEQIAEAELLANAWTQEHQNYYANH